jgi:hypothetical protein
MNSKKKWIVGMMAVAALMSVGCGGDMDPNSYVGPEVEEGIGAKSDALSQIIGKYSIVGAQLSDSGKVLSQLQLNGDKTYQLLPFCVTCMIITDNGSFKLTRASDGRKYITLTSARSGDMWGKYQYSLSGDTLRLRKVGTSKWFTMKREEVDCTTTGCAPADYCTGCWGHMACIPQGALC